MKKRMLIPLVLALFSADARQLTKTEQLSPQLETRVAQSTVKPCVRTDTTDQVGKFRVYNLSNQDWDRIMETTKKGQVHGKKWNYQVRREPTGTPGGYFIYLTDPEDPHPEQYMNGAYVVQIKWLLQDSGLDVEFVGRY